MTQQESLLGPGIAGGKGALEVLSLLVGPRELPVGEKQAAS